jgi:hypothetical protein
MSHPERVHGGWSEADATCVNGADSAGEIDIRLDTQVRRRTIRVGRSILRIQDYSCTEFVDRKDVLQLGQKRVARDLEFGGSWFVGGHAWVNVIRPKEVKLGRVM